VLDLRKKDKKSESYRMQIRITHVGMFKGKDHFLVFGYMSQILPGTGSFVNNL
jgi:hypothetical protein